MSSEMLCVAVAARRGADGFQKHTWMELPAQTTLRAVGRSIDPDGQLLHVEARKDIDGELSEFVGGMLDRDLAFVVGVAHMQYIKCCFAVDRFAAELRRLQQDDGKKAIADLIFPRLSRPLFTRHPQQRFRPRTQAPTRHQEQ